MDVDIWKTRKENDSQYWNEFQSHYGGTRNEITKSFKLVLNLMFIGLFPEFELDKTQNYPDYILLDVKIYGFQWLEILWLYLKYDLYKNY